MGEPELGYVSLVELATVRGKLGLPIERDLFVALLGIIIQLFAANPDPIPWELAAVFLAALAVYLGTYSVDYISLFRSNHASHPHDVALFKELLATLKPENVLSMFGQFDFGGACRYEDVRAVMQFSETWHLPDKEFIDKTLETAKKDTLAKAKAVSHELAIRTRPMHGGMQTVKLANVDPQPARVLRRGCEGN